MLSVRIELPPCSVRYHLKRQWISQNTIANVLVIIQVCWYSATNIWACVNFKANQGVVVAVIVWQLDLQLPMQSVPITTDVVSWNLDQGEGTTLCNRVCQCLATGRWFSLGPLVSSTNKTDRHDLTEILLKVALNIIKHKHTDILLLIVNHELLRQISDKIYQ